jgi:hypothetical protein
VVKKAVHIMANPWFRLYSEFAHDPKIQMLSEAMQRRYVMLMCLRCSEVLETLHETEIAFQLRLSTDELDETKQLFISKNFIDKHWNLLNWDKRQFVSDSSTMRVAKHRNKKKQVSNVGETLQKRPSNATDTDTDTEQIQKRTTSVATPSGVSDSVWQEFKSLRKAKKAPITQRAIDKISEEANLAGWTLEKALEECIVRGWQAFKADWVAKKGNPADNIRLTVPASNEPDPELEKIKADAKTTRPPTPEERAILNSYRRKA